jgi:hypothetical protein
MVILDCRHVLQKNFPFNNFRELNGQYMLEHSVESRMLPKLCNCLMQMDRETLPRTCASLTMSVYRRSRASLTQNKVPARHNYPRINVVRP